MPARRATPLRLVPSAATIAQLKLDIAWFQEEITARRIAEDYELARRFRALQAALSPEEWRQWLDARGTTERAMREFLRMHAG